MDYFVLCLAALTASGLTLFSGFGLGTLLVPAFALFFPIESAVAMTAVVHFANNLFKLVLIGKHADRSVVLRFGIPAFLAALAGAGLLAALSNLSPVLEYSMGNKVFQILPIKLVMACLMIAFALFEALPRFRDWSIDPKYLPAGGVLSGFFGGLSGHQGALRSVFLLRSGLSKESFIGTGVAIACLVDVSRLGVYGTHLLKSQVQTHWPLIAAAVAAAFLGAFLGSRLIHKVTLRSIQALVSLLLILIALLLGAGVI